MKNYLKNICLILESNGYINNSIGSYIITNKEINLRLMEVSGRKFIYLLCDKYSVIYVGRTKNLYSRLTCHKMDKIFTDIILIEYLTSKSLIIEKDIIKLFKPKFNICWVKKRYKRPI